MKVTQSCPTLCDPIDYTVRGILQARILEWVAFPFSRGSSQPRDQTQSPVLQVGFLSAEPQGKPKNTGIGSLFLFQWIFPTQESNWCLLHCRGILYQPSFQGSPDIRNVKVLDNLAKPSFSLHFYYSTYTLSVLVTHLHLTLRSHGLYRPPGSSVHGIFQARILE